MGKLMDYWRAAAAQEGQLGAQLGAPTMNINPDYQLDPSQVVFAPEISGATSSGFGGWGPYGGGGGGSWSSPYAPGGGGGGGGWGLWGMLDAILMGGGGVPGVGGGGGGGGYGGGRGGGTSGGPPGRDFGGYDITPENLITRQGLTGVPQAVRTLLRAEKVLGVPGLSEAVTGEGYRSTAQQSALYADYLAGRHPAVVAPPGKSYHEQGEAFDISSAWLAANPKVQPWLERHGFVWDVPSEAWHAHYQGGGLPLFPQKATGNQGRPIPSETHRVSSRPESRASFMRRRQGRY